MKVARLDSMINGWFVGDFIPTIYKTDSCEVAVKKYAKGDYEEKHYHKIATEITVIVSGHVKMFDCEYKEGDIIVVNPGEATSFEALEDSVNVVVKLPGILNDKYVEED